MDLWQLKVFCKVIELSSFSKAAEAVHLSQPTVSSHIKDLEDHFGIQLVDRLSRKTLPTKAGDLLYNYARRQIALLEETESAMAEFMGATKGELTIGGSTIPGGYLLPRLIGLFCRACPDVRVTLLVADTSEITASILDGRMEVGLVGARMGDPQLEQVPLIQDQLKLVVPAGHRWADRKKVSLQELKGEPFIARESGSGTLRSLLQQLKRKGFALEDFKVVAQMGSTEAIRQGIKARVGISILSSIAVADDVQAGLVRTLSLEELPLKRHFYLTTNKHRSPSPLCRTFVDFLKALPPADLDPKPANLDGSQ